MNMHRLVALAIAFVLAGCGTAPQVSTLGLLNVHPGSVAQRHYDGVSDDLLTAGLASEGFDTYAPPAYTDPLHPTSSELRRNAIFNNYRAIVDINPLSGYGRMYGPQMVAGTEYITYDDDGSGTVNVTLMVQLPDRFDVNNPCVVVSASGGSSGIYGAIAVAGEWGLLHGCAVAYADKGSGTGLYTFDDDSVNLRDGVRATRTAAGKDALFAPSLDASSRAAFGQRYPNRLASKHAHSQQNPEARWGEFTLHALSFAFSVLNQRFPSAHLAPANTIVIAAGASNGGGAVLRAAEIDNTDMIGGVVVAEPQVQVPATVPLAVRQGGRNVGAVGKPLFDFASFAALYQPCVAGSVGRCAGLAARGLVNGVFAVPDSLARLHAYGWTVDADVLQPYHAATNVLVAVNSAYAYGRIPVTEPVCGFSFAAVDALGLPTPMSAQARAQSFANQSGIAGSVVYERAAGGARAWEYGVSPSSGLADESLDGFLCLRALATGRDPVTDQVLTGERLALHERIRQGMAAVLASGKLHQKPTMLIEGRSDAMIPPNHGARAYAALNALAEGAGSRLRYVEVEHANHFDIFTSVTPMAVVPLNLYLQRGLDAMYAHLKSGTALPPSQLVRAVPRWSGFVPLSALNVPPIQAQVGEGERIIVTPGAIDIPD